MLGAMLSTICSMSSLGRRCIDIFVGAMCLCLRHDDGVFVMMMVLLVLCEEVESRGSILSQREWRLATPTGAESRAVNCDQRSKDQLLTTQTSSIN